ncbi:hypothetical protein FRB91_007827 [Serendipita sp. 411]|nr:hypothetical protein FRB91_007827 [Serendipita sp. 411]
MSDSALTPIASSTSSEASTPYSSQKNSPTSDTHTSPLHSDSLMVQSAEPGDHEEKRRLDTRDAVEILTASDGGREIDNSARTRNSNALSLEEPNVPSLDQILERSRGYNSSKRPRSGTTSQPASSSHSDPSHIASRNQSLLNNIVVYHSQSPSLELSSEGSPLVGDDPFELAVWRAFEPLIRKRYEAGCAEAPPVDDWDVGSPHSEDEVDEELPRIMRITIGELGTGLEGVDTKASNLSTINSSTGHKNDSESILQSLPSSADLDWAQSLEANSRIAWRMRDEIDSIRKKRQNTDRFYIPLEPSHCLSPQEDCIVSTSSGELSSYRSVVTEGVPKSICSNSIIQHEDTNASVSVVDSTPSPLGPQPTFRFIGVAVPSIPWLKTRMLQNNPRSLKRRREDTSDSEFDPTTTQRHVIRHSSQYFTKVVPDRHSSPPVPVDVQAPDQSFGPCVDELNASLVTLRPPSGNSLAKLCHNCRNSHPGRTLAQCGYRLLGEDGVERRCNKSWCERCLRYWYGFDDDAVMYAVHGVVSATHHRGTGLGIRDNDWVCAYCLSLCLCTLCSRERSAWRLPYRPSKNARLKDGVPIKRRGRHPKQFISGIQNVVTPSTTSATLVGSRRSRHVVPQLWLPRYDLPSASLDPIYNPPTRPCTRDFPTGAPVFSAVDYAPTVYQNGSSLEDDGHEDSFSDAAVNEGDADSGGTTSKEYSMLAQRTVSRKNYVVVVPGKKLPTPAKQPSLLPPVVIPDLDTPHCVPELSLGDLTDPPDEVQLLLLSAPDPTEHPSEEAIVDVGEGLDGDISRIINFSPGFP